MRIEIVDLITGIAMMSISIALSNVSPWLFLTTLIIGMNLGIGNLRRFYNKIHRNERLQRS